MRATKTKALLYRNIFPAFIVVAIIVFGSVFLYYQEIISRTNTSTRTAQAIISKMDRLLESVHTIAKDSVPLLNQNCQENRPHLIKNQMLNANIRTINLLKDETIICSTNTTAENRQVQDISNIQTDLVLSDKSSLVQNTPILFYNHKSAEGLVAITLSAQNILDLIQPEDNELQLYLKVYQSQVDKHGQFVQTKQEIYDPYQEQSRRFSYEIITGFARPIDGLTLIKKQYAKFILLILAAFTLSFLYKKTMRLIDSPQAKIKQAHRRNEFVPYVQPVLNAPDESLCGVEVLMRWQHPSGDLIAPDIFIPIAEQSGIIKEMTQTLFKQVGAAFSPYKNQLPDGFHIGFNIAPSQCTSFELVADCLSFQAVLDPAKITLVVEITERELIEQNDITKNLFEKLDQLDIKVALDDFGIGNSSLSYLTDFKINYLKIDKSFVKKIGSDPLSVHVLDTIIELTHKMQLESVAEGVETPEQAEYLKKKGVRFLQGYLYGKPVPIADFLKSDTFLALLKDKQAEGSYK